MQSFFTPGSSAVGGRGVVVVVVTLPILGGAFHKMAAKELLSRA